jgi:multicomponent Na+:H+ antiporter subunit D
VSAAHPALALLAAAFAVAGSRGIAQRVLRVAGPALALAIWWSLEPGSTTGASVGGFEVLTVRVDALSLVFGLAMCGIALIGSVYSLHQRSAAESAAALVYAAGSLGVIFAGDWLTLFACWELMAVSSLLVIWSGASPRALAAGSRYLLVHAAGGATLLAGILLHVSRGGSFRVTPLDPSTADPVAFWLILTGVALNAAVPPLHAWLTDAYPEASVGGAVFLSAFTTKTAVYLLIRVFPGTELLVPLGVAMALYGVVYAVLENDVRRLLAYHIVSQVGYMVAGVGLGSPLALDGAAAHAYCHILYKALLFMGAGALIHATGRRKLTELGGVAGSLRWVVALYAVGAVSISGFPLFNGFVSKSMVISAAGEAHRSWTELLLTLASVGTFLHTGLKLPYFAFFAPDRGLAVRPVPANMYVAMAAAALLCFGIGVAPGLLYAQLPNGGGYAPYTAVHVATSVQLLLGTGLAFWALRGKLGGEPTRSVDADWLYRTPGRRLGGAIVEGCAGFGREAARGASALAARVAVATAAPTRLFAPFLDLLRGERTPDTAGFDEDAARMPIGATVLSVVAFLCAIALLAG